MSVLDVRGGVRPGAGVRADGGGVAAATAGWLRKRDLQSVVLIGRSTGAQAVLRTTLAFPTHPAANRQSHHFYSREWLLRAWWGCRRGRRPIAAGSGDGGRPRPVTMTPAAGAANAAKTGSGGPAGWRSRPPQRHTGGGGIPRRARQRAQQAVFPVDIGRDPDSFGRTASCASVLEGSCHSAATPIARIVF